MIALVRPAAIAVQLVQVEPGVNVDIGPTTGLLGSAVGAFLTTLVVGGLMIAIFPTFTERTMADVLEDPIGTFLYGLVSLVAVVLVTVLLVVTVVGILLAIPFGLVAYLLWAIGAAVAYLAIGERLVGREDGWLKPLFVGAGINGLLTVTGVGGLLALAVGAAGFGAVLRDVLE